MEKVLFISLIIYCCSALPSSTSPPSSMFEKIERTCPTIKNFVQNSSNLAECKYVNNPEMTKPPINDPKHNDLVMCISVYAVMHQICSHNSRKGISSDLEYKVPSNSSEFDTELNNLKPKTEADYDKQIEKICGNILFSLKKVNSVIDAKDPEFPYIKDAVEQVFEKQRCNRHCYQSTGIIDSRCVTLLWASNLFDSPKSSKPVVAPPVKENQQTKVVKIEDKPVNKIITEKTSEIKPKEKESHTAQNHPSVVVTEPKVEKKIPDTKPQTPEAVKPVVETKEYEFYIVL